MDNLHQEFGHFFNAGLQSPKPLPPSRNIELMRCEVTMPGPCCACKRSTGTLTCGRCKAIKYCSKECQKNGFPQFYGEHCEERYGWKDHKDICNKIKKQRKETKDAIQALAEDFGGVDVLLRTPLVKKGRFKFQDIAGELMGEHPSPLKSWLLAIDNNQQDAYVLARKRLIEAYAKCGEQALSCTAFRLAAENMLDLLCLCYSNPKGEHGKYNYCGWMVAGGMDQQALNYLCYFQLCQQSTVSLPYLDLSKDEDIEGVEYLKLLTEKKGPFDWSTSQWFHDYMLIALIKYKRLQYLLVQRQKDMASWNMFMMGTHQIVGRASEIQKLRGNSLVLGKLKVYVMGESTNIDQLNSQIELILTAVNGKNPLIIPGIIDRRSIPKEPSFEDEDEELNDESDEEFDEHGDDIHDACLAFGNYGHAWNMSTAYPRNMEMFLRTGKILSESRGLGSSPVEGFLQAAFDVDPTRFYGRQDDLGLGFSCR